MVIVADSTNACRGRRKITNSQLPIEVFSGELVAQLAGIRITVLT
jgi:hypothetical protein